MVYVTKHKFFKFEEFVISSSFPELAAGLKLSNRERSSYTYWVQRCGDPWRLAHKSKPIIITRGFADRELNKAVGGATDSDHMYACAIDFTVQGMSIDDVFCSIVDGGYEYRQLRCYIKKNFIHWSWNIPGRRYKKESKIIKI